MEEENIEQFKRDLMSYKHYVRSIRYFENQLLDIQTRMENVKSPRMDGGGRSSNNGDIRLSLIEFKSKIEQKKKAYELIVREVDAKLQMLDDEERDIVRLAYVEHVPIRKLAKTYYTSNSQMQRLVHDIIKKII